MYLYIYIYLCYFEQYIIYYIMCTLTLYCCFNCTACPCCCHFIHVFHISTSICQTNLHSLCDRVKIKSGQVIQLENQTGGRETLWLFESNTKHPNALSSAMKEECRRFLAQGAGTEADSTKCAAMLPASVHVLPIRTPGSAIAGTGVSAQFTGVEGPGSNSSSEEGALVQDLLALREIASRANTAHNVYSRFFLACTDHHQTPERLATPHTINSHAQGVEDRQSSPWSSARHLRQVAMSLDFASKTPFSSCESRTQVFL